MSEQELSKVAMVIVAHPDDAEFGCAGTVASWVKEGWEIYYVICTDASGGGPDDATDLSPEARRRTVEARKQEQRAAGAILGLKDVFFLDRPDGMLQPDMSLRKDLVRLLRTYKPSRVICPSPERSWVPSMSVGRYHPDHLAAGVAALAAIYPMSQNPWDFPELMTEEGLKPHNIREVYIMSAPVSNFGVDISETFDTKIKALHAHESQITGNAEEFEKRLRGWAAETGSKYNLPMAEEFHRVEK